MEQTVRPPSVLTTKADYEAAIEDCFARMESLREWMRRDQMEIERLKAETRATLDAMRSAPPHG